MIDPRLRLALARTGRRRRAAPSASGEVLARMKRELPRQRLPDGPFAGSRPLARVNLEPEENWLLGLLDAWAKVAEIVGFYEARFGDEGYLATAVEELSVHELIRLLGYPARPGIAGSGWVAYTLAASRGMPDEVTIARRAIVQSLPIKGQLPQTFELAAALTARREWNALRPEGRFETVPPMVPADATELTLAGIKAALKPGQPLLIRGIVPGDLDSSSFLRSIETVKSSTGGSGASTPGASTTVVSWKEPLDEAAGGAALGAPEVFSLRRRARLFGYNAVPWAELPAPAKRKQQPIQGGVLIGGPSASGHWQGSNEGLPAEPIHALLASGSGVLWAGTAAGLYVRDGESWRLADARLGRAPIQSLAGDALGRLWAGTSDGRVLASADGGGSWGPLPASPATPFSVRLARKLPAVGALLPASVQLPKSPIEALLLSSADGCLLAAGASGAFANAGSGAGWHAINQGLPGTDPKTGFAGVAVHALVEARLSRERKLWAGTTKGVFSCSHAGGRWHSANEGLPGYDAKTGLAGVEILALAAHDDRRQRELVLVAGTAQGVYRRVGVGPWRPANVGLPTKDPLARTATVKVSALAAAPDPATLAVWLWAGTDQGLFVSTDLGATWSAVDTGQAPAAVSALAASAAAVAAGTSFDGYPESQWPGYALTNGEIDLATVEESLVPGSWLVLTAAEDDGKGAAGAATTTAAPPPSIVLLVNDVTLVRRTDFGHDALVTRVMVSAEVDLSAYSLRDTVVLYDSQSLPLATTEKTVTGPIHSQSIRLSTLLESPLPPQHPIAFTGRLIRARLPRGTRFAKLLADGRERVDDWKGLVVTVLSQPEPAPAPVADLPPEAPASGETSGNGFSSSSRRRVAAAKPLPERAEQARAEPVPAVAAAPEHSRWLELDVRTAWGEITRATAPERGLVWMPSETADTTVSELAWVAGCSSEPASGGNGAITRLELVSPLAHPYDAASVTVAANVAEVVQGETVVEAIGSGDAARALQTFALTRVPLNYRPAADAAGMRTTLEIRVDGVRWSEVPSFHGQGPGDRVYVVRRDLSGRPIVTFGDGLRGARLPTGQQNVQASYASGLWSDSLEHDQLAVPRTRPLGVQGVTNPVPTTGATPAETQEELRQRAPRSTRPLARIVSLADFEDFALTFPGISRARLAQLTLRGGPVLSITVAGIEGAAVEADGMVATSLRQAIAAARLAGPAVVLQSYAPVLFTVAARLRVDPAFTAAVVVNAVRSMLAGSYGFASSRFAQILAASQVLSSIRGVAGVADVELTAFCRSSEQPLVVRESLTAELAHRDGSGGIAPAELLLIDGDAISLTVVTS